MLLLLRLFKLLGRLLDQLVVVLCFLLHQLFFLLDGITGTEETHVELIVEVCWWLETVFAGGQ